MNRLKLRVFSAAYGAWIGILLASLVFWLRNKSDPFIESSTIFWVTLVFLIMGEGIVFVLNFPDLLNVLDDEPTLQLAALGAFVAGSGFLVWITINPPQTNAWLILGMVLGVICLGMGVLGKVVSASEDGPSSSASSSSVSTAIDAPGLYLWTVAWEALWGFWRFANAVRWGLKLFVPVAIAVFVFRYFTADFATITDIVKDLLWYVAIGAILILSWGLWRGFNTILSSVTTLMGAVPDGDFDTLHALGVRRVVDNTKEMELLKAAHKQLRPRMQNVPDPKFWGVLNSLHINSFTVGRSVILTRQAVYSDHLPVIIAHEIGHLKNNDGIMLLALRRLVENTAYSLGVDTQMEPVGILSGGPGSDMVQDSNERVVHHFQAREIRIKLGQMYGGIGLWQLWPHWADYWKERDFLADDFVASIGMAPQLIAFLENHEALDVAQPYYMRGQPYIMERIGRLTQYTKTAKANATTDVTHAPA